MFIDARPEHEMRHGSLFHRRWGYLNAVTPKNNIQRKSARLIPELSGRKDAWSGYGKRGSAVVLPIDY
jgi:hypothetical protein